GVPIPATRNSDLAGVVIVSPRKTLVRSTRPDIRWTILEGDPKNLTLVLDDGLGNSFRSIVKARPTATKFPASFPDLRERVAYSISAFTENGSRHDTAVFGLASLDIQGKVRTIENRVVSTRGLAQDVRQFLIADA